MTTKDASELTLLLNRSRSDPAAREQAFDLIYSDLRRLAGWQAGPRGADLTLSATALINEAYLRLLDRTGGQWNDRAHFLRVAAKAMRQITIDAARQKSRIKRGGSLPDLPLHEDRVAQPGKPEMVLAVEEGLAVMAEDHPRWVAVVEMRFFAGLSGQDTAEALDVSLSSVNRDWAQARAWLRDFLTS